ncbi:MAG: Zn-ribbon domain-containing OB-fold protein [Pseudomonadales bacterium]
MATRFSMQRRLRMSRPSLRVRSKPPRQRTPRGEDFTAANLGCALSLQKCTECGKTNYPPREVCEACLHDELLWTPADTSGRLLQAVELHHSLWEFFKRRMKKNTWPIASVRLAAGPVVYAHLALELFELKGASDIPSGSAVAVFSHSDSANQSVLIAVPGSVDVSEAKNRLQIADSLGITTVAEREATL